MNAGEFLIAAVYEVASAAIFAIAAGASEEARPRAAQGSSPVHERRARRSDRRLHGRAPAASRLETCPPRYPHPNGTRRKPRRVSAPRAARDREWASVRARAVPGPRPVPLDSSARCPSLTTFDRISVVSGRSGLGRTGANRCWARDTLSRYERVEGWRGFRSFAMRAKWLFRRGVAKSTKERTLATESRPCGQSRCTGTGGSS